MSMQLDKYTIKSREAVQESTRLAQKSGHQELMPEHLLFALLEDRDGLVRGLLERMDADVVRLRAAVADS